MKTPEEEIRRRAIDQLSKEKGIAPYFVQIDLDDEFISRCIHIALDYASQFQQPKKETKTIEDRKQVFLKKCEDVIGQPVCFDQTTIMFFDYWTEIGDNQKKMRFEKEKVFDIKKRLERWKRNQKNFNNGNKQQSAKPTPDDAIGSFISG